MLLLFTYVSPGVLDGGVAVDVGQLAQTESEQFIEVIITTKIRSNYTTKI